MANTNLTGNGTVVFDSRLWGGVGEDDTAWLQSPMGSNSVTGTISLGIVDLIVADGDAAAAYDLALATNAITGSALIGILSLHNTTTAAGNAMVEAGHVSSNTLLKWTPPGGGVNADVWRVTFLYR